MDRPRWGWMCGLGLLVSLVPLGCGKPPPAPSAVVRGVVTFQGRPLGGGLVVFVPDADKACPGKLHTAVIGSNGDFALANGAAAVVPGWYRVAVSDPPGSFTSDPFPAPLRRPDSSKLEREVKPGHDHHFEFLIELTR